MCPLQLNVHHFRHVFISIKQLYIERFAVSLFLSLTYSQFWSFAHGCLFFAYCYITSTKLSTGDDNMAYYCCQWTFINSSTRNQLRERERARMACKLNKPLLFVVLFFFIRFMYNHNNSIGNNNNNNGSIVFLRKILWLLLFFSCLVLTKWFLVMMTTNKTGSSQNEWKLPSKSMMVGEKYYAMGKMDWLIQWRGHAERMNERVSEYLIKCRPP